MGRVRLVLISLVALVVALGAAFLARGLAAPPKAAPVIVQAAPPPMPTVKVLVAKRELAVGDRLDAASIGWRDWPKDTVADSYITDGAAPASAPVDAKGKAAVAAGQAAATAAKMVGAGDSGPITSWYGAIVREPLAANEPLMARKLVKAGAGGVLAVALQPGMRAISVPLTKDSGAGGFIQPGDHVDVVQIRRGPAGAESSTVMRNVRVLAVGELTRADPKATTQEAPNATVELSPVQAEDLVLARAQGELTLVLRSYADAAGPARTGDIERVQPEPVVHVFRDGQSTDVKVTR